jgi:hypothetical protein
LRFLNSAAVGRFARNDTGLRLVAAALSSRHQQGAVGEQLAAASSSQLCSE